MEPNPRDPDPAGMRVAELVISDVPFEVGTLRQRLEQLRREHADRPLVVEAIDRAAAALDELTTALVRNTVGADGAPRRGHR